MQRALRCRRQIEAQRPVVPRACRQSEPHCQGAAGGAPEGNRNSQKHGDSTAESIKMARKTMAAIEHSEADCTAAKKSGLTSASKSLAARDS